MTIEEMQAEVDAWIGRFAEGYFSPEILILRLVEELGELAREVNHVYGPKHKKADEPEGSIALELGDMLFVVTCFANSLGLNLEEIFHKVMEKYYRRDANRWPLKNPVEPIE